MIGRDLKLAVRSIRRAPLFACIVIGTLAVGIGVNTAMFSVVDAVLIRPLPYPDAERVVMLGFKTPDYGTSTFGFSSEEYFEIVDGVDAIDAIGVYDWGGGTLTGDGGNPEEPTSLSINVGFQEVTGLEPLIGRAFTEEDTVSGANRVLMLGEELWRRRYDSDPGMVGKTVLLDEREHEVIGIVPESFRFPDETGAIQVFKTREMSRNVKWQSLGFVARLKEGTDAKLASAQLESISSALAEKHPEGKASVFFAKSLHEQVVGDVSTSLYLLWGAVGFVLLLACMNAANLLLARSASRSHEIAVRAAIGAPRRRIVRQVLSESVVLSLVAALLGLLIAQWSIEGVAALGLSDLPRGEGIGVDGRAFVFTFGLALITGLLYGLLPALQVSRVDLSEMMKEGAGRASVGRGSVRLRSVLTVGQVAIACVLLIGAGLMIRSSIELRSTDPGFAHENVMGMTMWADQPRGEDDSWIVQFYDDVLQRIRNVPGVSSASMVNCMPWQGMFDWSAPLRIEGHPDFAAGEPAMVKYRVATHDYLQAMDVPLLRGRHLSLSDDDDAGDVAVVSRALADRFWPEGGAVGQIVIVGPKETPVQIVGVVENIRERRLDEAPEPTIYVPFLQKVGIAMTVMVASDRDPELIKRGVQESVWAVMPTQGIWRTRTLDELLRGSLLRERVYLILLVAFAIVAVVLASVGIYGVISFSVAQRTREIGIRMALGAQNRQIMADVLSRGLRLSAVGLVVGLPLAWAMTRFIGDMLYEVGSLDPATYVGVSSLVGIVATVACCVPAYRAIRIPPASSLRAE